MAEIIAMPAGPLQIERIPGSARSRFSFMGKTYVTSGHGYQWPHPSGDGIVIELIGAEEGYQPDPDILVEAMSLEWVRYYRSPW